MSIDATAVWEIRTAGSDANAGAYVPGAGIDYSQQDAAPFSLTDVVANGTTTLTSATGSFTANMVNNGICLSGGTGALARTRRQIVTFNSATSIVVDAAVAAGTGIIGKVGGALASLGEYGAAQANGVQGTSKWQAHYKAGAYTVTSTTFNVSGGVFKDILGGPDDANRTQIIGYSLFRGDDATTGSPVMTVQNSLSALTFNVIELGDGAIKFTTVKNVDVNCGTGNTTSIGIHFKSNSQTVTNCDVTNNNTDGRCVVTWDYAEELTDCVLTGAKYVVECLFSTQDTTAIRRCQIIGTGATTWGIRAYPNRPGIVEDTSIRNCQYGVYTVGLPTGAGWKNCTITGCTLYGLLVEDHGNLAMQVENFLFYSNSGTALASERATQPLAVITHCAFGNNGTDIGNFGGATLTSNVTLTADPFTNLAGGDLTLNNNNPGGAQARGAGTGGVDIGAFQSAAGGSAIGAGSLNRLRQFRNRALVRM